MNWSLVAHTHTHTHLCSLHHLLVQVIWEGPHGAEFSRALSAREYAVLIDQSAAADGDQGNAVTAETLVQVDVSSLDLVIYGNDPAWRSNTLGVRQEARRLQRAEIKAAERLAPRWGDGSSFVLGSLGVPDHHISICSRDDPPFPGVEVVDLGCVRARDRHEAILVYLSSNLSDKRQGQNSTHVFASNTHG